MAHSANFPVTPLTKHDLPPVLNPVQLDPLVGNWECGISVYARRKKMEPRKSQMEEKRMLEKELSLIGYWLGTICAALALILRLFGAFNMIPSFLGAPGGNAISYLSFLHGAELFLVLSIAASCRLPRP